MKAPLPFLTILFLLSSHLIAQKQSPAQDPFAPGSDIPKPSAENNPLAPAPIIPILEVEDAILKDVIELIQSELRKLREESPNFIFLDRTEQIRISSLSLRNVSSEAILTIVQSVAGIEFETIADDDGTDSLIVRRRSSLDPFADDSSATDSESDSQVYMFPIDGIGVDPKSFEQQVCSLWDLTYSDWQDQYPTPRLLYHEGTEVFIVKANRELGALVSDLINTIRLRQEANKKDLLRVQERNIAELQMLLEEKEAIESKYRHERIELVDTIQELEFQLKKKETEKTPMKD